MASSVVIEDVTDELQTDEMSTSLEGTHIEVEAEKVSPVQSPRNRSFEETLMQSGPHAKLHHLRLYVVFHLTQCLRLAQLCIFKSHACSDTFLSLQQQQQQHHDNQAQHAASTVSETQTDQAGAALAVPSHEENGKVGHSECLAT